MLTDRGWSNKKFSLSSSPKSNIITKEYFAMIHTILDTDLYKFTTSYAYIKLFPYAMGTFSFKDRDDTAYTDTFLKELQKAVDSLAQTVLTAEELEYMTRHCRFLPRVYWEWLSSFRFQPEKVSIHLDEDRHLNIEITDYLYKATLYEVPLLSIVSEIKNRSLGNVADMDGILCKLKYDMKPMGTHPHEWFMFHGAQFGYKHANYMALENWVNVYDGDLGIALSDTYTSGIFLSNLSRKQAKLFDGVRCDSGDEFDFTDKLVARYRELGIDPTTKTIVFSNALDFGKALDIQEHCRGKIRCSFGIGTNLTNDTGFRPSNIVMKLTQCKMNVNQEWRECVKLSDDAGKHIGSEAEVRACLYDLRLGQQIEPLC